MTGSPYTPPKVVEIPAGQAGVEAVERYHDEHPDEGPDDVQFVAGGALRDAAAEDDVERP